MGRKLDARLVELQNIVYAHSKVLTDLEYRHNRLVDAYREDMAKLRDVLTSIIEGR